MSKVRVGKMFLEMLMRKLENVKEEDKDVWIDKMNEEQMRRDK